ncbi:MAG TPA: HEPN domain-containing protein [Dehalococcoidia bacterium]|nr:HEPN domain-containing protein [Dehalococcoidia bacterium]
MVENDSLFLRKAVQSLAGAESELLNARYDNTANRCYYGCFQAAIVALERAGIQPRGGEWGHAFVPSQFEGQLIYRRKLYDSELRGTLEQTYALRAKADYSEDPVTQTEANRVLRRTRTFVATIRTGDGT